MKSKLFIIILVFLLFFGATVYLAGYIKWYVDLPSFILVIILPYIIVSIIFSAADQRKYFQAALSSNGAEPEIINKALLFFKTLSLLSLGCTAVSVFLGFIAVFASVSAGDMIVPSIAITLICPLYYSLLYVMIIVPLTVFLRKNQVVFTAD